MVEVARLESVYRFIAYRGFESPSLRQGQNEKAAHWAAFSFWRWGREASPLRGLRGGFEGLAPAGACRSESPICFPLRGKLRAPRARAPPYTSGLQSELSTARASTAAIKQMGNQAPSCFSLAC